MKTRIIIEQGQYSVERREESKTLGVIQWIWIASFFELGEAKRCYPTAELMPVTR